MAEELGLGIGIAQIFLESVHFQHQKGHLSLPATTRPGPNPVKIELGAGRSDDHKRGLVRIRVRTAPDNPLYVLDVSMVALLKRIEGEENWTIRDYLASGAGATLLFPFVREAIASVSSRGRFGPIMLSPIAATRLALDLSKWGEKPKAATATTPEDHSQPRQKAKRLKARKKKV